MTISTKMSVTWIRTTTTGWDDGFLTVNKLVSTSAEIRPVPWNQVRRPVRAIVTQIQEIIEQHSVLQVRSIILHTSDPASAWSTVYIIPHEGSRSWWEIHLENYQLPRFYSFFRHCLLFLAQAVVLEIASILLLRRSVGGYRHWRWQRDNVTIVKRSWGNDASAKWRTKCHRRGTRDV